VTPTCPRCGGPTVALFYSRACAADCQDAPAVEHRYWAVRGPYTWDGAWVDIWPSEQEAIQYRDRLGGGPQGASHVFEVVPVRTLHEPEWMVGDYGQVSLDPYWGAPEGHSVDLPEERVARWG
jgi:hypothetical protein